MQAVMTEEASLWEILPACLVKFQVEDYLLESS